MEDRKPGLLAQNILNQWDEMAQTLFPEGVGPGLKNLVDDMAARASNAKAMEHAVVFGNQTRFLYRLSAEFTVDRPLGSIGGGYTDGSLHQSIHYKPLHGGSYWGHLAGLVLAHVGLESLQSSGITPSAESAALPEKSFQLNEAVETLMFSTVNLFAQCGMLEEVLDHVEGELRSLELEAGDDPKSTANRARLLEVILEERAGQVEANVQNNLRMLRAC
ncbi:MAG: hypothetical protein LW700_01510 [Gemmataceae bacterium]|jgi:hypothetical protein|nr:hypothetical protein [Gemmataceae bacterium]